VNNFITNQEAISLHFIKKEKGSKKNNWRLTELCRSASEKQCRNNFASKLLSL